MKKLFTMKILTLLINKISIKIRQNIKCINIKLEKKYLVKKSNINLIPDIGTLCLAVKSDILDHWKKILIWCGLLS